MIAAIKEANNIPPISSPISRQVIGSLSKNLQKCRETTIKAKVSKKLMLKTIRCFLSIIFFFIIFLVLICFISRTNIHI